MRLRRMTIPALLIAVVVMFWGFQAGAYGVFQADPAESGNCSQCHSDFPGTTHSVHTAVFSCDQCHVGSPGANPVLTSACAACHTTDGYPDSGLFALHGGLEAPNEDYCGYCHEGVPAEGPSLTELRNIFD